MCWNKEVSFGSFIIISLVCYLLYKRNLHNDRLMAIFIMGYGSMQLFETIIWIGIEYNKPIINKIGTLLASLLLYFHPLIFLLGLKYDTFYKNITKKYIYKIVFVIAILFIILGVFRNGISLFSNKSTNTITSYLIPKYRHLVWDIPDNYNMIILFLIIVSLIFIFKKNKMFMIILLLYYIVPALYTYYTIPDNLNKNIAGSYWCWIVAFFSFLIYFTNPMLQKYNSN
jgi:hypothetical protein